MILLYYLPKEMVAENRQDNIMLVIVIYGHNMGTGAAI